MQHGPTTLPCRLELARHLVFGAVDYARGLGFEPHPDFARGAVVEGNFDYVIRFPGPG